MSDDNFYDPKPPTLEECARVVKSLTLGIAFLKRESLRSSMAEQQFCKLPVAGSSPAVGSLTPEEREAIQWFSQLSYGEGGRVPDYAATLRSLLERLK